jgi:hypothetical protein
MSTDRPKRDSMSIEEDPNPIGFTEPDNYS